MKRQQMRNIFVVMVFCFTSQAFSGALTGEASDVEAKVILPGANKGKTALFFSGTTLRDGVVTGVSRKALLENGSQIFVSTEVTKQNVGQSSVERYAVTGGTNPSVTMRFSVSSSYGQGAAAITSSLVTDLEMQRRFAEQSIESSKRAESFYGIEARKVVEATTSQIEINREAYLMGVANIARLASSLPKAFDSSVSPKATTADQILSDPLSVRKYKFTIESRAIQEDATDKSLAAGTYSRATRLLEPLAATGELKGRAKSVVNAEGVFEFERIDSKVPLSPLSVRNFSTGRGTEPGQIVRRVANRYQAYWANSRGLQGVEDGKRLLFAGGLASLAAADEALAKPGQFEKGSGLLKFAFEVVRELDVLSLAYREVDQTIRAPIELVKHLPALSQAIGDGVGGLGYALVHYGANPDQAIQKIVEVVQALPGMKEQMWSFASQQLNLMSEATPREVAQVIGDTIVKSTAMIATAGTSPFLQGKAIQSLEAAVDLSHSSNLARIGAMAPAMRAEITHWMPIVAKYETAIGREVAEGFVATAAYLKTPAGAATKLGQSGWTLTPEKLDSIVAQAEKIWASMPEKGIAESPMGFRGLRREFVEANKRAGMTEIEAVHAWHESQILTPNRHSGVGIPGIHISNSQATASAELEHKTENYIFAGRKYELKNVLDLTQKKIRDELGITQLEIGRNVQTSMDAYETSQIIGYIAYAKGYDAIKYFSVAVGDLEATNWVIFSKAGK